MLASAGGEFPCWIDPVRFDPVRIDPVRFDPVRFDPVRIDPVRFDPVRFDLAMQADPSPVPWRRFLHRVPSARMPTGLPAYASLPPLRSVDRLLRSGAIKYLQPEITKIGGLTPAKRSSTLAQLYNVALCPHNFRLGPSLYACLHWGLSCPVGSWIEIPWLPQDRHFPAAVPLPELNEGKAGLPLGAGALRPSIRC